MCLGILLALECQRESGHEGILLWLIGIPIPIIILLYFFHASEYRRRSGKGQGSKAAPKRRPPAHGLSILPFPFSEIEAFALPPDELAGGG
ncbi:hypothetical protein CO653_25135 [Rhizobium anhuiense]|nr:hypothetical protein AS890_31675 [Rhizobium anhuiense bv. trifolii]PDS34195.1 hypothetical protein CO665_31920 [Rhizobium anhuiense]PDS56418.1 hypothetical protein CO663_23565 [Rhizobium anhuiense]PDS62865.1 hypothetical protein CO653_25135 [Rhizobium anhuiense]